jgi:hypothetical protein
LSYILIHKGNANQKDTNSTLSQSEWLSSRKITITNADKDEGNELLCPPGRDVT